jgi:hypothetical protein
VKVCFVHRPLVRGDDEDAAHQLEERISEELESDEGQSVQMRGHGREEILLPVVVDSRCCCRTRQRRAELLVVDEVSKVALVVFEEEETLVEVGEDGREHIDG